MAENNSTKGILYLIPCGLCQDNPLLHLPALIGETAAQLTEFIVEDERTARRFLKALHYPHSFNDIVFHILNKHTSEQEIPSFLDSIYKGKSVGVISEAGLPCIADPGAVVVRIAHMNGIRVVPLSGPSSILLALMSSGLNGQSFAFHGYLPIDPKERSRKIQSLEKTAMQTGQTQIFMETPYRNGKLFEDILRNCSSLTMIGIASDLTSSGEFIATRTVEEWKKNQWIATKTPTIFIIGK